MLDLDLDLDLQANGKHLGWLHIPHSTNESAFGRIEIPVVSIRNGEGPRILCLGGVHGDEYIGQIFWSRLIRRLEPEQVRGQLVILPAANTPSAVAGTRCSPLDQGNLNRIFPGKPDGKPTERIAHFIEHELIARSDFLIDLHGGAATNLYISGPTVTYTDDAARMKKLIALLRAFGGPRGYVFNESRGGPGGTLGATRRHGIDRLGTEIGGGGSVTPADVSLMHNGVLRVLVHLGVLDPVITQSLPPPETPRILRRRSGQQGGYIFTPEEGLFEPFVERGDSIVQGQPLGQIMKPELPEREPTPLIAPTTGVLMSRCRPGRVSRGDVLMVLADDYKE